MALSRIEVIVKICSTLLLIPWVILEGFLQFPAGSLMLKLFSCSNGFAVQLDGSQKMASISLELLPWVILRTNLGDQGCVVELETLSGWWRTPQGGGGQYLEKGTHLQLPNGKQQYLKAQHGLEQSYLQVLQLSKCRSLLWRAALVIRRCPPEEDG